MQRFLVTLRSHAGESADEVLVEVVAPSCLAAIRSAVHACPMGPWAVMRATPCRAGKVDAIMRARGLASKR